MRLNLCDSSGRLIRRSPRRISGSEAYLARLARRRLGAMAPERIMVEAYPGFWTLWLGSRPFAIGESRDEARLGVEFACLSYATGR